VPSGLIGGRNRRRGRRGGRCSGGPVGEGGGRVNRSFSWGGGSGGEGGGGKEEHDEMSWKGWRGG